MNFDQVAASLRAFDILWEAGYREPKITEIVQQCLRTGRDPVAFAQRMVALAEAVGGVKRA